VRPFYIYSADHRLAGGGYYYFIYLILPEDFMIGVNKVILIGNLGKDPELRYTPGGQPVATFSLATTERWNDRNGQRQDRTEWHNIVAWGKLGELVNQYLKKGRSAYIEGRITTRSWDDKDGNKRYKTEIVANQIQFLGASGQSAGEMESGPDHSMPDFDMRQSGPEPTPANEDDLPF
jgi:single-strand DNA-binding protein